MIEDPSILEQGYIYFRSEAPDLIQTIEQELFNLSEEHSTGTVHNLMRATHTLKGGAANIGLEVINQIAHSLEDIFKALYNPEVVIDPELLGLLFQAYECLQLALSAELNGNEIDSDEILQRTASVCKRLQDKLGDAFSEETCYIPTSEELGFDITLSIFETGVNERIENLAKILQTSPSSAELADYLSSNAEVFLGLAESLNLSGFQEISQNIINALQANPSQVLQIAKIALADLQQSQAAVLGGDRIRGGEPSPAWQQFFSPMADPLIELLEELPEESPVTLSTAQVSPEISVCVAEPSENSLGNIWEEQLPTSEIDPLTTTPQETQDISVSEPSENSLGNIWEEQLPTSEIDPLTTTPQETQDISVAEQLENSLEDIWGEKLTISEIHPLMTTQSETQDVFVVEELDNSLEDIWGEQLIGSEVDPLTTTQAETQDISIAEQSPTIESNIVNQNQEENSSNNITKSPDTLIQVNNNSVPTTNTVTPDKSQVENKKSHDKSQAKNTQVTNKNLRLPTFVRVDVEGLQRLNYLAGELLIFQKRRYLQDEQLQGTIEQLFKQLSRHQETLSKLRDLPLQIQDFASENIQEVATVNFDSLEMDEYTEFHLALHAATEEALQLQETTESLEFLLKNSHSVQDKKQRLLFSIIENLEEARMLPLGNILNRFPKMLQNLTATHHDKNVDLKLYGTEVLIDKAIAEKLYDPLLHLLRNSFDHGIEPEEIRRQSGKPEQGLIEIRAYNQGSQTIIEVADDGQGLNLERIRNKGIDLGLIDADDAVTEEELLELLFSPGFSTAGKISEISGRGMGLDIVRSYLESLNGSISVNSVPKVGTTFLLKIPFSMTTDQLMIVQAGDAIYALLLENIEKIVLPSAEIIKEYEEKKVLHWKIDQDERIISIRPLADLIPYGVPLMNNAKIHNTMANNSAGEMKHPVLVLRGNQELFAVEVDQIIGEQELVIRPLGNAIVPPKYIYGCSSLADGSLILVIDAPLLLKDRKVKTALDPSNKNALAMSLSSMNTTYSTSINDQSSEEKQKYLNVVLVVDDAISLRQTLALTLQKYGYQVLQAENGVEALEQMQRHPEIQIVVSDLEMPRMNGFELLSNLRQSTTFAQKPVIVLTSRTAEKHRQLAKALGATAYFSKPYLEHELISTIRNLVNNSHGSSAQLVQK